MIKAKCVQCGKPREIRYGMCWPCAKLPKNARRVYRAAVEALDVEAARQLRLVFDPKRMLTENQLKD